MPCLADRVGFGPELRRSQMRSSTGEHFAGLDHIRAVAAFLVVMWHFAHGMNGSPVPFNRAPELALVDEGHVGVSLFMTLSGYLFAKLISNRPIDYAAFLWNRAVRLLPLLFVVLTIAGLLYYGRDLSGYGLVLLSGLIFPTLPNGGWSLTVEAHFYLILPAMLLLTSRWIWTPLAIIGVAILVRLLLWLSGFEAHDAAYWTIIGRIDQFAAGIFFSQRRVSGYLAMTAVAAVSTIYFQFDRSGGFYAGPDWFWILLPTIEAVAFGAIIAWYDHNPLRSPHLWLLERAGKYSYSIYLIHPFFVFAAAPWISERIMPMDNIYVAIPWGLVFFIVMIGVGHLSFRCVEEPPMRLRRRYIKQPRLLTGPAASGGAGLAATAQGLDAPGPDCQAEIMGGSGQASAKTF